MNASDAGFNPTFNMATIKQVINEAVERVRPKPPDHKEEDDNDNQSDEKDREVPFACIPTRNDVLDAVFLLCRYLAAAPTDTEQVDRCVNQIKNFIVSSSLAMRMPTPMRLRDLIRQIRAARTAAEERSVVNRECAYIRSTFRDEDSVWRCRNIAKLLYIHMLGYPAHFGQLECLKLIASPRFTDKRIGYLGAMLLLDERQDVHLLITNCLKNDLNSPTQFIVGLALCTLGAIASPEMSRDLASEVERLLKSPNAYIRKKAALCAFRIILKVPELMEIFLPATRSLLSEKNHGILITGVTLITEMCEHSVDTLHHFRRIVPNLVRILKNLILAGYSPEHDVCGVSDPFLQVKILRLLRILGKNDTDASEAMNDILAQVATNTESNKNVGYTILYETVLSIMDIKSESGLRVLAVNILGRFLLNNDKNIRYVALNTLLKTVHIDTTAVQRHRSTILDCLEDMDVSIRKRALELSFALINSHNIRNVMIKLLKFLEKADPEFKAHCSSNIVLSAEKFAQNTKWHLDTLLKVLIAAGNYVRDDVVSSTIQLISESVNQQSYIVYELWNALQKDTADRQPLTQVATWVIGEFGDLLLSNMEASYTVTEEDILEVYQKLLWSPQNSIATKQYTINSLMKLSSRFTSRVNNIREIMQIFASHIHMEMQQRGSEYSQLFSKCDNLRPALLERMPPLEVTHRENQVTEVINGEQTPSPLSGDELPVVDMDTNQDSNALLVLLGGDSQESDNFKSTPRPPLQVSTNQDLLDLLGSEDLNESAPSNGSLNSVININRINDNNNNNNNNDIVSLNTMNQNIGNSYLIDSRFSDALNCFPDLGDNTSNNHIYEMVAYDKNGLKIIFFLKPLVATSNTITINMEARNKTSLPVSEFLFQVAVPKTFQLLMLPPSGTVITPNSYITQELRITNPIKSPLRMRIRLSYNQGGLPIQDMAEINDFPSECT